jgi:predicted ATPase/DNA-binding winged helix-turn-helix (wHTH) protein
VRAVGMFAESTRPVYASGECEIDLARRELRVLGSPVPVGGRAFEIIEVLARSAGELVTKDELMNRIWPGTVVMENTLQVHAAAVRKALGPYRGLLKTESRRGYRLLGDWTVRRHDTANPPVGPQQIRVTGESPATNFPAIVTHLVGRSAAVQRLQDLVSAYRVVTLTGPGGIGKTILALKVARQVLGEFADGGWLVELASLSDPELVPSAVAGVLGLRLGSNTISPEAVARAVAGKKLLLVLDNCEHVIDAAATLTEVFVRMCPRATILATSREVFRIEGEHAYRVPPLEVPAKEQMDADQIRGHSAPELFIARAKELGSDFSSRAESLTTIAAICRHLDGIPLAIEFAASRAATLGIEQVAAALGDRFALLTSGRRTPLPRHRTLRATLDWSYDLLADRERLLLQRLAVFSGSFSLAAASAVTNRGEASQAEITDGVTNLVAKSLVTSDITGGAGYFRLLETTRVYALSKLTEGGELQEFSRRHAEYYQELLEGIENEWEKRSTSLAHVDNVRAALEWCFGINGNPAIGVGLAATAAPIFLAMSLLPECHRWSERAILALDDATRGGSEEMRLQASLGVSSMQMHGQSDTARAALSRALAIAEARGDVLHQVELLGMLSMFHVRDGDFKTSLHYAKLSRAVDGTVENSAAMALANSILGRALQFVGDHSGSRVELEASFQYWSRSQQTSEVYLGLDHHILVGIGLARNLWLQGHPAQATERVRQTIKDAERKNHPASLGLALSWAPGIFLWIGDLSSAEEHVDWSILHAEAHSLGPYLAVARGYKGALAIGRGDARGGVENLLGCLKQLHAMRYEMPNTGFKLSLVQGLMAIGQFGESLALVDETIRLVEVHGDLLHTPEALRVKGSVLLSMPQRRTHDAEMCFIQSLDWSRRQGARSWELRTAVDLAALWAARGQRERAHSVLRPIFEEFAEGLDTADLKAAERLLATLR